MRGWSAFMERQGFYVMLGVCVAVIVGTAIWTRSGSPPLAPPEYLQQGAQAGSEAEFVQRLSDVTWTGPASSGQAGAAVGAGQSGASGAAAPAAGIGAPDHPALSWPVSGEVLRPHSGDRPVFLPTLGAWGTHEGIDIRASVGDPVNAALSGTVSAAYEDPLLGSVIEVQHPGGLTTRYIGLATLELLRVGDPVKTGQLLSPLGKPGAWESEDPPHLHFEVLRDGEWVDPQGYLIQK
ncbi:MAG: M23 family metallopeptidase [Clostridia bacterium]|nr:M23 family metallopeptidase [Clostridia bacterium]